LEKVGSITTLSFEFDLVETVLELLVGFVSAQCVRCLWLVSYERILAFKE